MNKNFKAQLIDPITEEVMQMDRAIENPIFIGNRDPANFYGTNIIAVEDGYTLENVYIDVEKRLYRIFKEWHGLSGRVAKLIDERGSLIFGKLNIGVVKKPAVRLYIDNKLVKYEMDMRFDVLKNIEYLRLLHKEKQEHERLDKQEKMMYTDSRINR